MAAPLSTAVRVRLFFDYPPPVSPECRMCWLFVDLNKCRVVTDLASIVRQRFGFSRRAVLNLFIDDCLLPPDENIYIVRDNDCIRVKLEEVVPAQNGLHSSDLFTKKDKRRHRHQSVEKVLLESEDDGHKEKKRKRGEKTSNVDDASVSELDSNRRSRKRKKNRERIESPVEDNDSTQSPPKKNKSETGKVEVNKKKKAEVAFSTKTVSEQSKRSASKLASGNSVGKKSTEIGKKVIQKPPSSDSCSSSDDSSDHEASGKRTKPVTRDESKVTALKTDKVHSTQVSSLKTVPNSKINFKPKPATVTKTTGNSSSDSDSSSSSDSESTKPNKVSTIGSGLNSSAPKPLPGITSGPNPSAAKAVPVVSKNAKSSSASSSSDSEELVIKKPKAATESAAETNRTQVKNGNNLLAADARGLERESPLNVGRGRGRGNGYPWRAPRGRGLLGGGRGRGRGDGSQFYFDYNNEKQKPQQMQETVTNCSTVNQNPPEAPQRDYSALPLLAGPPAPGERIAFKRLQLTDNYTPELSDYKEGRIVSYNSVTQQIKLEILSAVAASKEPGKFDLVYQSEDGAEVIEYAVSDDAVITERWDALIEPRLIVETSTNTEHAAE